MSENLRSTFEKITPALGWGDRSPGGWLRLADQPLVILVGVTGVGKSTTLRALQQAGAAFTLLPDRRTLTDHLIIAELQRLEGLTPHPVVDRRERFDYTRRYRQRYPGGMAHALTQLWFDPLLLTGPLVFDGLRGSNEVGYAVEHLPHSRFVVLHAPDAVRIRRLLARNDTFDHIRSEDLHLADGAMLGSFADLGLGEAAAYLSADEQQALLALAHKERIPVDDLARKVRIVIAERQNYDPAATRTLLQTSAPDRTLAIDTTEHSPEAAAGLILTLLNQG
jgi:hypothetical protein